MHTYAIPGLGVTLQGIIPDGQRETPADDWGSRNRKTSNSLVN